MLDRVTLSSEGSFIDAELVIRAQKAGFTIVQIGVDYFPRTRGVSTLSSPAVIRTMLGEMARLRGELKAAAAGDAGDVTGAAGRVGGRPRPDRRGVPGGAAGTSARAWSPSTSLLAVGRSFDLAVRMLADHPDLDVGAHLAIVGEDPPLLTAREIPTLVDRRGAFPLSYRTVVLRGMTGRLDPDDVRREFGAQLERIRAAGRCGVPPGHPPAHPSVAGGGRACWSNWPRERWHPGGADPAQRPAAAGRIRGEPAGQAAAAAAAAVPVWPPPTTYAGLDEAGSLRPGPLRPRR